MKVLIGVRRGEIMDRRLYLLILGATLNLEDVKRFIDGQNRITDWFCSMPNSIFLVSTLQATEIYDLVRSRFSEGRMFITEVSPDNRQGWLPRDHWNRINSFNSRV